jgi:hypothetical protein
MVGAMTDITSKTIDTAIKRTQQNLKLHAAELERSMKLEQFAFVASHLQETIANDLQFMEILSVNMALLDKDINM